MRFVPCMARRIRNTAACAAACLLLAWPGSGGVGDNCPTISANNTDAVVFITAKGTMYNGTVETEHGTGFFVTEDGYLLTANHVIFVRPSNYRTVEIEVSTSFTGTPSMRAAVVDVDAANDIALLKVQGHFRRVVLGNPAAAPVGAPVDVLGFMLGQPVSILPGIISSKPKKSAWQTTVPINLGASGSPVFSDADEKVIGIATGGATHYRLPDGSIYFIEGVKYFAPLDVYQFPVGVVATHAPLPVDRVAITSMPEFQAETPRRGAPESLTRAYHVSFEKTDHPVLLAPHSREFVETFNAQPGYRFAQILSTVPASANHESSPRATISEDRTRLEFRVTLTSGPLIDQYRGWYDATILTRQTAVAPGRH